MALTIQQMANGYDLRVTGDIDTYLTIPADRPKQYEGGEYVQGYYISLSDGSLIRLCNAFPAHISVETEGAGYIDVDQDRAIINVGWPIEWITLTSNLNASAVAANMPAHATPQVRPDLDRRPLR